MVLEISAKIRWYLTKVDSQGRIPLPRIAREFETFEENEIIYVAVEHTGKTSKEGKEGLVPFKETEAK